MNEPHDLRAFLRAVGAPLLGPGPGTTPPPERPEVTVPVDVLDPEPVEVAASPLDCGAFVDGIQATVCVTYRHHRPVYLRYIAAGAVGRGGQPVDCREVLELACGVDDADWAREVGRTIPVHELPGEDPDDIVRAAIDSTGAIREALERELIASLAGRVDGYLVCDGSLVGRSPDAKLVGVVKDTTRRYLPPELERTLWGMGPGWRSMRFRIKAGNDMGVDRYSCYLRLHDARRRPWNFSLVRLEAFNPDVLDSLAARAYIERQGAGAPDGRWERHLQPVRMVEDFLRARRPFVFG